MDCPTARSHFSTYREGGLSGADRQAFVAHSAACPKCTRDYAEFETALAWLGELDRPEAPADIRRRVLARLREGTGAETAQRTALVTVAALLAARWAAGRRRSRYWLAGASTIAVAAVAAAVVILPRLSGRSSQEHPSLLMARNAPEAGGSAKAAGPPGAALPEQLSGADESATATASPQNASAGEAEGQRETESAGTGTRRSRDLTALLPEPEAPMAAPRGTVRALPGREREGGEPMAAEGGSAAGAAAHFRTTGGAADALTNLADVADNVNERPRAGTATRPAAPSTASLATASEDRRQGVPVTSSAATTPRRAKVASMEAASGRFGAPVRTVASKGGAADKETLAQSSAYRADRADAPERAEAAGQVGDVAGGGGRGGSTERESEGVAAEEGKVARPAPARRRVLTPKELGLSLPGRAQVGKEVRAVVTVQSKDIVSSAEVNLLFSDGLAAKNPRAGAAANRASLGPMTFPANETVRIPLSLVANEPGTQSVEVQVVSEDRALAGQARAKVVVVGAPAAPTKPAAKPDVVKYKYDGADLRKVLQTLSASWGKRLVLDPDVKGEVTYKASAAGAEAALRDICLQKDLKVTEKEELVRIEPAPE